MRRSRVKFYWAFGMISCLAFLGIIYAVISSNLNIQVGDVFSSVGSVEFVTEETANSDFPCSYWYNVLDKTYHEYKGDDKYSNVAKALGEGGTCTVSTTTLNDNKGGRRRNDTLTIEGTKIYDFGATITYEINLVNMALHPMKLANPPWMSGNNGNYSVEFSVYDPVYDVWMCLNPWDGESDNSSGNYLAAATVDANGNVTPSPGGYCRWYMEIKDESNSGNYNETITLNSGVWAAEVEASGEC